MGEKNVADGVSKARQAQKVLEGCLHFTSQN